ncbi:DUF1800 domain-containing protein [Jatrophihabitans fulvus]
MTTEWSRAAHLVRRTGFGATGDEVDAAAREGTDAYVARILAGARRSPSADPGVARTPVPTFDPLPRRHGRRTGGGDDAGSGKDPARAAFRQAARAQGEQLVSWWLRRMIAVEQPLAEKATFVWHSHFATSLKKVKVAALVLRQNERQRAGAVGSFDGLARAMLTDDATQVWLDNQENTVDGPNENLSREYMELFTLGHGDGYTEKDVREGARALTGYQRAKGGEGLRFVAARHDATTKTVLGRTGELDADGFCAAVLARPEVSGHIVRRLWPRYVSSTPPSASVVARLASAFGPDRDIAALLTAMVTDPAFADAEGSFVVGPVEWAVGAARALRVPTTDDDVTALAHSLDELGQLPFFPPSVGGWPSGPVWLSTAAAELRFRTAGRLAAGADLDDVGGSTTARLEAVAHRLGVAAWSPRSLAVLKGAAAQPRRLVAVALNTPEYLVH